MKKVLLTGAILSLWTLQAQAASIRLDEETFSTLDLTLRITAQRLGKARSDVKDWTDFSIRRATINMAGQANKYVKFEFEGDFSPNTTNRGSHQAASASINDAVITLDLADELKIRTGKYRVPFARANLTSSRNYVIPTGIRWGAGDGQTGYKAPSWNPFAPATLAGDRDYGMTFWGNIADGLFQYRVGIFDGKFDHTDTALGYKDNIAYGIRLEMNPVMLGYKADKGWGKADSYLGKMNVFNIGVAYWAQKWDDNKGSSGTAKAYTVDALWEQKFGDMVPNLQLGYIGQTSLPSTLGFSGTKPKTNAYYVQGQLLYDQMVGIGKPALALRYEYSEYKNFNMTDPVTKAYLGKGKVGRTSVFLNYYIKGWNAVLSAGVDIVNPNGAMKRYNSDGKTYTGKNFTDFTIAMQTIF
ncbi:porin [Hydrogenobacter hydrogenophilus]|uniref:Phosphate-selective porin O and P n=1 Tax=Hydrogenobacter hydrogenophilus TaxID=35835 RepID=A0A285NQG9_9AQUI|nr:porin [Hydrogenobacter hydrogenophilus]SNZ11217.1 Phosphate-selective porin O and P [Hydrogenobacter hydrogenophilus]